jgi:hypothetical protein
MCMSGAGTFLYQFASLSALISDTPHAPPCREFRPLRTPARRNCNGARIHREFHLQATKSLSVHFPVTEHAPFTLLGEAEQFTVGNDGYNYAIPFFIAWCLITLFVTSTLAFLDTCR